MKDTMSMIISFGTLSLLAVGGGNTIIPDIHRETVIIHKWMTDSEFAAAFAIAKAAPGPGALFVALIGWKVSGWLGSILATLAMYTPSGLLIYFTDRLFWSKIQNSIWRLAIEKGLVPISIGLIYAGGWVIGKDLNPSTLSCLLIIIISLIIAKTKINPLLIMIIAGILGSIGILE